MSDFKDKQIEQLFADERFSPLRQKLKMLETAEELFELLTEQREYPFEFICYKITGYRPKSLSNPELIDSNTLKEDLLTFILLLSKTLSQPVQMLQEPVLTVEQAAKQLKVSTKTINRYRTNALVSRSFIFEDGKRRIGILKSSLGNFVSRNKTDLAKSRKFSRLNGDEKDKIINLALKLASQNPRASRQTIIKEVASQTKRATETIRYTLINNFKSFRSKLDINPAVITPKQAAIIYNSYEEGEKVAKLAEKYSRSKSSIYRIINQQKQRHIMPAEIKYIGSEEFNSPKKVSDILKSTPEKQLNIPIADIEHIETDIGKISSIPLLNRDKELELFRLYNCIKFEAARLKEDGNSAGTKNIGKIESLLKRAEKIKNMLVCVNLRLVLSIARNHINRGAGFADLVSEGSVALMRAVEGYNYTKGFRFATYAGWAITRSFAEIVQDKSMPIGSNIEHLEADIRKSDLVAIAEIERAGEDLEEVINKNLNEREQYIIRNHFGLEGSLIRKNYKSMNQIGSDLGISGERVRQIELQALQKLRQCLSSEMFDSLLK